MISESAASAPKWSEVLERLGSEGRARFAKRCKKVERNPDADDRWNLAWRFAWARLSVAARVVEQDDIENLGRVLDGDPASHMSASRVVIVAFNELEGAIRALDPDARVAFNLAFRLLAAECDVLQADA